MTNFLTGVIAIAIILLIAKFILHIGLKGIIGLLVNSLIGFAILWLIGLTGLIVIPITIITCLVTGILGLPGIILLIILALIGII